MREDGDQSVLPQKGGFPGHVRAGHDRDFAPQARSARQLAIIWGKGLALDAQRFFNDRMAPVFDPKGEGAIDFRPSPVPCFGELGKGRRGIDCGKTFRRPLERRLTGKQQRRERVENRLLAPAPVRPRKQSSLRVR